jgi:hypothetical protein
VTLRRFSDRARDRQGGIGRELETQSVVESLDRSCERQVPFLDEVEQWNIVMRVLAGDPDHETEIGLDQKSRRTLVSGFLATKELTLLRRGEHPYATYCTSVSPE